MLLQFSDFLNEYNGFSRIISEYITYKTFFVI